MSRPASSSPEPTTCKLAIAAFTLGILGLFTGVLAIPAIFCGRAALRKAKNSPNHSKGENLAKAGLRLAYATVLILLIITTTYTLQYRYRQKQLYGGSQNMALQLRSAISAYYIEYKNYPIIKKQIGYADLLSNAELMDCLWALEEYPFKDKLNPRGISFFLGKTAWLSNDEKYHNGSHISAEGHAELFDAWGNYFYVRIDLNGAKPVYKPFFSPQTHPHSIRVWSAGKDGISGTGDDLESW